MFVASQSCCEVSRPRAVGEYEYRLLGLALEDILIIPTHAVTRLNSIQIMKRGTFIKTNKGIYFGAVKKTDLGQIYWRQMKASFTQL